MPSIFRFEEILNLLQEQIGIDSALKTSEVLISASARGLSDGLASFSVQLGNNLFCILGLTSVKNAVQANGLVQFITLRARARRIEYIILSNQRETILQTTPQNNNDPGQVLRRYAPIQILTDPEEPLSPLERLALTELAHKIASDLITLGRDKQLDLIEPDADYFVDRLIRAMEVLKPTVKRALSTQLSMAPQFADEIATWATKQGIPADVRSPDFAEAVVRQAIYRLLGKIIFYQSLRRAIQHLPEMDVASLDTAQVMPRLLACFNEAHKIDYHAVFREDVVDRLPFPAEASAELRDLVNVLNTRDFAHLPQDVVGSVFERLIPPEDRHALGQYFTPENLVDLIVAFCVHHYDDTVMDPTCGTGTFLIRAYDRKRTALGLHDHNQQLGYLWGIDIAPFPAELATINLFRQQVGTSDNFPRVLNEDFFIVRPGGKYDFPPLRHDTPSENHGSEGTTTNLLVAIPQFDAILGNFPYISADRIEQHEKGYSNKIALCLAEDWFQAYPAGFTFASKVDERQHRLLREQGMDVNIYIPKALPVISTFADMYISLFWHAAAFLKPGGRMGIVTSNAWLDVGYGYGLQRFFLDNFKIIAILESRCEPWFQQAAVNTVVTIVERCQSPIERDAHPARFVKIKRPLADLMPWDMRLDGLHRWVGIEKFVQRITSGASASDDSNAPHTAEDDDFRIRAVRQSALRAEVNRMEQTVKWGRYLRAPQVYFDLLKQSRNDLILLREIAPPSRGNLTGNNEFYYFDENKTVKWAIEPEFLYPLLKSPGDSDRILIDEESLNLKVFVCRMTKQELLKKAKLNALRYIEWGEKQVYKSGSLSGLTWANGIEVRNRKPGWYALPTYRGRPGQVFFSQAFGNRFINKYSPKPLIADARLYFLSPIIGVEQDIIAALMNSSLVEFFVELAGRVTMGDGALELKVEDASNYLLIPDARRFDESNHRSVCAAFQPLLQRPIGSMFDEIRRPDRQALDRAVLTAIGLDANVWLPRLYDGLTTLVRERVELGKKRNQSRISRTQKAASRVAEEVLSDLLPDGVQRFPGDFFTPAARANLREIPLPEKPIQHKGAFFGKEEMSDNEGTTFMLKNIFEVRYVLYTQANGQRVVYIPQKMIEVTRTVNLYSQYLRDLRLGLYEAYFRRTLDQIAANRFVEDAWRKLKLPPIE